MTGSQRINRALERLNVIAFGGTARQDQVARAKEYFDELVQAWNADGLLRFALRRLPVAYVASTATYTLGPGQTWNTGAGLSRPTTLERAYRLDATGREYPIDVFQPAEWDGVADKTTATSMTPSAVAVPSLTAGTNLSVVVYPSPLANGNLVLSYKDRLPVMSLSANVELPELYDTAFGFELMRVLAVPFNRTISAEAMLQHAQRMADLKGSNIDLGEFTQDVNPYRR